MDASWSRHDINTIKQLNKTYNYPIELASAWLIVDYSHKRSRLRILHLRIHEWLIQWIDITQETQALPTNTSNEPFPIHPIHPIHPPLIASPSPPSNLETSSKTMDSRKILKSVAPSKRPVTERPTQNSRDKLEVENAFFPKELADIIAIR